MVPPLLKTRRFLPLFLTQALGALNDNMFKNALAVLALFRAAEGGPEIVAMASAIFISPYMLFSATAGQLADRYEKSSLIRITKGLEVLLMLIATAGFLTGSLPLLLVVLFGLGCQATFFSPLKYAILPTHLAETELVAGNGLIEAGTFLGILAGTILGGALILGSIGPQIISALGLVVAAVGLIAAWLVPAAIPALPNLRIDWNILAETRRVVLSARAQRPIWLAILALSWFWTLGAIMVSQFPVISKNVLGGGTMLVTVLLTMFAVGIGFGSVICSAILKGEVTQRYVPFAALGISIFAWDFSGMCPAIATQIAGMAPSSETDHLWALLSTFRMWRALLDLLLLAVCGGLYSVPLYALIQERSRPAERSRMIGANNILNAALIVVGAIIVTLLATKGVSAPTIVALTAGVNLAVVIWMAAVWPQDTLRGLCRLYFDIFHRAEIRGLENLQGLGDRVIYVVNHLSFADGTLVASVLPEATRMTFAVNSFVAKKWWAAPVLSAVDTLLVDPSSPYSVRAMIKAVREGKRLMIFPEGRITRTGALMKIYPGTGMVADKGDAQIVPIHIDGLQYTPLGRLRGLVRLRLFPKVTVIVHPAVRLSAPEALQGRPRREALGRALQAVMENSDFNSRDTGRPLFRAFLDAKTIFGNKRICADDITYKPATYGTVTLGAAVLGRRLAHLTAEVKAAPFTKPPTGMDPALYADINKAIRVAVMLPNATAALVTFMGLSAFGRVPALLNFSAGPEAMLDACRAARAKCVISSRAFITKGKLEKTVERMQGHVHFIWLEDVREGLATADKLRGLLDKRLARRLPGAHANPDAVACVLFTSGTTGSPKAVLLSHRNILTNWAQVTSVVDFNPGDRVLNAMPMFHSFGLTGGTLLPLLIGARIFFYPSPLHYRIVPEAAYDTDATIVFGTDTFLSGWARYAHPYDFHTIRLAFAGAEKLRDSTRKLFAERFGVRVLEAYGTTETAPALAVNSSMNNRTGTVGRVLPGIETRLEQLEGADGAILHVRGANVMIGTVTALHPDVIDAPPKGWYHTGDVVTMDEERFVTIVGRVKRFAKPGGERISMDGCEELAAACWPKAAHAVIAIPDPRKGEALVLVTTQQDATTRTLLNFARDRGLSEIMIPRIIIPITKLPLLGSGKVNYPAVQTLVTETKPALEPLPS
jgi:acyl-[acyl-carrier-protein]-phospholipid O-acyltransferase/long-chain-fatty-acid--[acyl-carrier-protein] ligase